MLCFLSQLQDTNCLLESLFRVRLVGGVEKWENRKLGENRKMRGYKKFSFLSIVFGWDGMMEKWRYWKFICLVEKKNESMENEVDINLQLCPH